MENRGLIFIPDISGFTRFVNETEINHSRLIIQELLEIIINANEIGLEISEIEGDAILFYKYGDAPSLEKVYRQVEKMFCEFHKSLIAYEQRKYCQCTACLSAINLTLKVITHYGEFTGYNVRTFNKLIGKDIIVAHQLLKNNIDQHEYWLVTDNLWGDHSQIEFTDWMSWSKSAKETENGEIVFHYTKLAELKNQLPAQLEPALNISDKVKLFSKSREYPVDIITLFHATGDFSNRHKWQEGVKRAEDVSHILPRVGMKCKIIMENNEVITYSTSYSYSNDRIEFSETDEKNSFFVYYILEKISDEKTKLTIEYYMKKNLINQLMYRFYKEPKAKASLERSMAKLEEVVVELKKNVNDEVVSG